MFAIGSNKTGQEQNVQWGMWLMMVILIWQKTPPSERVRDWWFLVCAFLIWLKLISRIVNKTRISFNLSFTLFKVVITKNPKTEICEFLSISITQYILLWSSYSHGDKPLHEPCTSNCYKMYQDVVPALLVPTTKLYDYLIRNDNRHLIDTQ